MTSQTGQQLLDALWVPRPAGRETQTTSRVDIVATAASATQPKGAAQRHTRRIPREIRRFAAIGVVSTLAYLGLYAALRGTMAAQLANAIALLVTAVANTAANRRMTFDVRDRSTVMRHQLQGLGIFGIALLVTSGSLGLLHATAGRTTRSAELGVLVAANLTATALRFVLMRRAFQPNTTRPPRLAAPTTRDLLRGIRSLP